MTEKLYDRDSYIREFKATVLSCEASEDGFKVVLDRTAFFPEEGGQKSDTGFLYIIAADDSQNQAESTQINDNTCCRANTCGQVIESENKIKVSDVQINDNIICHTTDKKIPAGSEVFGIINWEERYDKMQNHTGEHLLSGIIYSRFGYTNVGFHLNSETCIFDAGGKLSDEDIASIEEAANKAIYENREIKIAFPSDEELKNIEYRSKKEIDGQVRLVEIDGYDCCACCAPHVRRTGEIGIIKIINYFPHRGGTRMEIRCGLRAYKDYKMLHDNNSLVMAALSSDRASVPAFVKKMADTNVSQKFTIKGLKEKLIFSELEKHEINNSLAAVAHDADFDALRSCVNALSESHDICAVLSKDENSEKPLYLYVISSTERDVRPLATALNKNFGGKGGGKENFVQGKISADKDEILAFFNTMLNQL